MQRQLLLENSIAWKKYFYSTTAPLCENKRVQGRRFLPIKKIKLLI